GNDTTDFTIITIVPDTIAPTLTVPTSITLDCSSISETASPAAIIDSLLASFMVSDNCDPHPSVTHNFDGAALDVCAEAAYDITISFTAVDACGNDTMATTVITIVPDTEAPVVLAPESI